MGPRQIPPRRAGGWHGGSSPSAGDGDGDGMSGIGWVGPNVWAEIKSRRLRDRTGSGQMDWGIRVQRLEAGGGWRGEGRATRQGQGLAPRWGRVPGRGARGCVDPTAPQLGEGKKKKKGERQNAYCKMQKAKPPIAKGKKRRRRNAKMQNGSGQTQNAEREMQNAKKTPPKPKPKSTEKSPPKMTELGKIRKAPQAWLRPRVPPVSPRLQVAGAGSPAGRRGGPSCGGPVTPTVPPVPGAPVPSAAPRGGRGAASPVPGWPSGAVWPAPTLRAAETFSL